MIFLAGDRLQAVLDVEGELEIQALSELADVRRLDRGYL
jgi:hypothetical protein